MEVGEEIKCELQCPFCGEIVVGVIRQDDGGTTGIIDKKDHNCSGFKR